MKLSLVVLAAGKQEGKVIEIKVPNFVIGRDPQCQLRPASPMISKRHCALIQKDGKVYLKDFGSTNGSFVNDKQVTNAVEVKNGDKLKIGPLFFEARIEAGASVQQPTPAPVDPARSGATKPPAKAAAKANAPAKVAAGVKPDDTSHGGPAAPAPTGDSSVDDDIAAMLLSGGDETVNDAPSARDPIPQGTTVFDLQVTNQTGGDPASTENKEQDKDKKKAVPVTTASAAADILEKMRKRPRT